MTASQSIKVLDENCYVKSLTFYSCAIWRAEW